MTIKSVIFSALAALVLGGCGSLSKVGDDGLPQGELVWPELSAVTFDYDRGTYGDLTKTAQIKAGDIRDQVYDLIGRPHFSEGFRVREWDYVFYFPKAEGEQVCQFKVLFDYRLRVSNTYWHGEGCPPSAQTMNPEKPIVLSADALFRFAGGEMGDLLVEGRRELDALIANLNAQNIQTVELYGYTDRLGSREYNLALSQQRAETVRRYLLEHGMSARNITAQGRGEQSPVKLDCQPKGDYQALVDCLQPNRRVEVFVRP